MKIKLGRKWLSETNTKLSVPVNSFIVQARGVELVKYYFSKFMYYYCKLVCFIIANIYYLKRKGVAYKSL